jgi:hypothetical protein
MLDDKDFYWDWAKHEDALFSNRANFFLVGETLLLASTPALPGVGDLALPLAGVTISAIWLYTDLNQVVMTTRHIASKLASVEPRWKEINDKRGPWGNVHLVLGAVMPGLFLLLWILRLAGALR